MYATAHLLRTPAGEEGVNSYLFLHLADPLPTLAADEPDVMYISQFSPGTCVDRDEDVEAGGNTVKCSLDVAGPDDMTVTEAKQVIARLREQIPSRRPPLLVSRPRAAAALRATLDFDDASDRLRDALATLEARILRLLARRSDDPDPIGALVVCVRNKTDGIELSLPSVTRARLGGSIAHRMKMLVPVEVLTHFPAQGPTALIEAACALTGNDREQLKRQGGIQFIDPDNQSEVLVWP